MSRITGPARQFFEACETGRGWDACAAFCNADATFSSQTGALADISTLEGYTEWMKGLFTPIPDGRYELKFFAADEADQSVAAFAVFHGTQTGPGGPVPPTGQTIAADYVYHIEFDAVSMQQLGWA
jgi:predicted ester cyclase